MGENKQIYDSPVTEVWTVKMENGLLQASIDSKRNSYGEAVEDEWE